MELPAALYEPTDDGFEATALTIGPWDPGLQHAGPPAALLLRAAERPSGIPEGQTVRLAYDIFGPVPVGPVRVSARPSSGPGRRIELVEAVLAAGDDRPLMRLSAWRMRTPTTASSPRGRTTGRRIPRAGVGEDSRPEAAAFFTQEVAYHRALEWRFATGSFNAPGPAVGLDPPGVRARRGRADDARWSTCW